LIGGVSTPHPCTWVEILVTTSFILRNYDGNFEEKFHNILGFGKGDFQIIFEEGEM
jgi:hypothetical protein